MKLLLVEDNVQIIDGLEYTFKVNDIKCKSVQTIEDAKKCLMCENFNIIILDISLPDGNGLKFFEEYIKPQNIPTIFLTAKDTEDDIVKGLELGACDYITKPFSTRELIARINKVANEKKDVIRVKDITFDMNKMQVYKKEKLINLTSLELRILYVLFSNIGKVVTRNYLIEYIWTLTGNDVYDNTVTVYLKRIREKIGDNIIITVKGIGYRIDEEE